LTTRERNLAIVMGVLVGSVALVAGVRSWYIVPRAKARADLQQAYRRRENLRQIVAARARTFEGWYRWTRRTLDADPAKAEERFRTDVTHLLETAGVQELSIRPAEARRVRKGYRKGFVELPLTVACKARLGQVVGFLKALYQRPYLVRVETLRLVPPADVAAAPRKGRRRRNERAAGEPLLTVSMRLATLVLPRQRELEHPTLPAEALEGGEVPQPVRWLWQDDVQVYDEIASLNVFKKYEPPKPKPKPQPKPPAVAKKPPKWPPPPPPPDPRRDADKFVLLGTASIHGVPVAYVRDTRRLVDPPEKKHLNDRLDDGTIVLIHPRGIVVRSEGPPKRGKLYFYPIGRNFKQREPLSPTEHPDVYREVQLVLKR